MRGVIICAAVLLLCLLPLCGQRQRTYPVEAAVYGEEHRGTCGVLAGEVRLCCIFVETEQRPWQSEQREQALLLLDEAGDCLEKQAAAWGGPLQVLPPEDAGTLSYGGTISREGEEAMLLNAAAEAWLEQARLPAEEQTAYVLLVSGKGDDYALPMLLAGERELEREKAVLYRQGADAKRWAAQLALLFGGEQTPFGGEIWQGERFGPAFLKYLGFAARQEEETPAA